MTEPDAMVSVRYMVDDVQPSIDFYTEHFGFEVRMSAPAFAAVIRGNLRLLLSGPASSAGRPMPDGATPGPGGWNRMHFIVDDLGVEVERLRDAGVEFRNDVVTGPWWVADPGQRPVGQRDRAVPARRRLSGRCVNGDWGGRPVDAGRRSSPGLRSPMTCRARWRQPETVAT